MELTVDGEIDADTVEVAKAADVGDVFSVED